MGEAHYARFKRLQEHLSRECGETARTLELGATAYVFVGAQLHNTVRLPTLPGRYRVWAAEGRHLLCAHEAVAAKGLNLRVVSSLGPFPVRLFAERADLPAPEPLDLAHPRAVGALVCDAAAVPPAKKAQAEQRAQMVQWAKRARL